MTRPPAGTVSLVFTDIQGSTALWEHFGKGFHGLLSLHNELFRDAIGQFGGYEVKTEGDAFMVAFQDAAAAVQMCVSMQQQLHSAAWTDRLDDPAVSQLAGRSSDGSFNGLRVRMGVHTGTPDCRPDPVTGRMDYFGRMVNRAARVGGAGHGGQILLSNATWEALGAEVGPDVVITDLGEHSLRGLNRAERLRQVLPCTLSARVFPPIKSLSIDKTNLVRSPDSFLGREGELDELGDRISAGESLISLLGPGGTGKTRLARTFGLNQLSGFRGGVWFCDLTGACDLAGIVTAMSVALELPLTKGDPVKHVSSSLKARGRALIILDNFEQVVDLAAQTVGRWRQEAPDVVFLVTSRTLLQIAGETALYLDPLPASDAVDLFFERGSTVFPQLERTQAAERLVHDIVERLDCMTLAVELAAARVRMLSLGQLRARLLENVGILSDRRRDRDARQSSLRGAISWSWDLLDPAERTVLSQMSVFRGGCTLESAEAVVDLTGVDDAPMVLDIVGSLVDHSLLRRVEPREDHVRYQMLECIRFFAEEKLGQDVDRAALSHAQHYSSFGQQDFLESLGTAEGMRRRDSIGLEVNNFLVAAQPSVVASAPDAAAKCVLAVCVEYSMRGPFMDGVSLLKRALSWPVSPEIQCRLQYRLGWLLHLSGNAQEALEQQKQALLLCRRLGERRYECNVIGNLAWLHRENGRLVEAHDCYSQAIHIARKEGYRRLEGVNVGSLANLIREQGDTELAQQYYQSALGIAREVGDRQAESITLGNLAWIHREEDRPIQALECFTLALAIAREVGNRRGEGITLANIAGVQRIQSDFSEAMQNYLLALEIAREVGNRRGEGITLANIAEIQDEQGCHDEAAENLTKAIKIAHQVGNKKGEGLARYRLGVVHRKLGHFDEASVQFETALGVVQQMEIRVEEGKIIGNLGDMMMWSGDVEGAERYLERAVVSCAKGHPFFASIFGGSLAVIRAQQGRFGEAQSLLDESESAIRGVSQWELVKLLCKRIQVDCMRGEPSAVMRLKEAEVLAEELDAGEGSELWRAVAHARQLLAKNA